MPSIGGTKGREPVDVVFLIGANIADNHPILCCRLEQNPNKTVVVADPRVSKTARIADIYLPLKPRSDIAAPGQVFMPFHYEEKNSNCLTQSAFDPISREPNYKQAAVRVDKSGASSVL